MRLITAVATAVFCFALAGTAKAVPMTVTYEDTPQCDPLFVPRQVHELGNPPAPPWGPFGSFPINEAIASLYVGNSTPACPSSYQGGGSFVVRILNLTNIVWRDLWYVADPGTTISNVDGTVNGMRAFRIDSVGGNRPLITETMQFDGDFQPNEIWQFVIDAYNFPLGQTPDRLGSIGVPSSVPFGPDLSTGSIIAIVPEPASCALALLGIAGLVTVARATRGAQRAE